MVDQGWADRASSWPQLLDLAGTPQVTLNKLALISKQKPDGSWKHRLIWDLLRSEVNSFIDQGERIVLPRVLDLVDSVRRVSHSSLPVVLLGTDFSDAFHQIPIKDSERRFTAVKLGEDFYIFKVLVFGASSAPTVWGRYAAFVGRSTAAIHSSRSAEIQIYVDDPIAAASGTADQVRTAFTHTLLWMCALGLPVAWHKTEAGSSLVWIGALISIHSDETSVSIPADKVTALTEDCRRILRQLVCSRKAIRILAGKLAFVAGLIPPMRAFLSPLWAVTYERDGPDDGCPPPSGRGTRTRLSPHLVHTSRVREALRWVIAFLTRQRGTLLRHYPFREEGHSSLYFTTDASPWGIGGVLFEGPAPIAWFHDTFHRPDLDRFSATIGESGFTTLWEALAILVAVRLWRRPDHTRVVVHVRSDSLGALKAIAKHASPSPGISTLLREFALEEAESELCFGSLDHIPGFSNTLADALSRLVAPEPKALPLALGHLQGTLVPIRSRSWWISESPSK